MDFTQAQFMKSVFQLTDLPPDTGAEVAFIGRSNVGKSSVINTLCQKHALARTSRTPGRTQSLNFFELGAPKWRLVDLPGYGFAKVPLEMKRQWQTLIPDYLLSRQSLRGIVIIMDCRHPLQIHDVDMIELTQTYSLPTYFLLNKADKLKWGQAKTTLLSTQQELDRIDATVQLFSAETRLGLPELIAHLKSWYR